MLQTLDKIFPYLSFAVFAVIIIFFYITGKKALEIFPLLSSIKVIYRDRFASGYSTKTSWLNSGRASKVLDVVVTEKELWLKGMAIFTGLCKRFDILHKIPLENILHIEKNGDKIIIDFKGEDYENKQVVVIVKNPEALLSAIRVKSSGTFL